MIKSDKGVVDIDGSSNQILAETIMLCDYLCREEVFRKDNIREINLDSKDPYYKAGILFCNFLSEMYELVKDLKE